VNTPPAAPSRPQNHAAAARPNTPVPPPPRQQAERQSLSDRFAAKLDREDSAKGTQQDEAGQRRGVDDAALSTMFMGEEDTGEDSAQSDLGQREALLRLTAAANPGGIATPATAAFDTALLSQIAAQIADSVPSAGASEVSIEFPEGSLAHSAHIRREPDGSIAIRLAGLDPRLSAIQNGRAQMDLRAALALRRLQVSSLTLERGQGDQDTPLPRPISRVV
jgi:hypothetical protein